MLCLAVPLFLVLLTQFTSLNTIASLSLVPGWVQHVCITLIYFKCQKQKKIKGSGETYSNCTAGSVSGDHNHWNPFAVLLHPWSLVCLWWWWVQFHFWMHFGYSASQKYSHREHSGSLILYHRILWNYDLCLNRKNKRKDCLLPKKTKFWCTGLKWQRIHQIPKYFFVVIHLHLICIQTSLFLV